MQGVYGYGALQTKGHLARVWDAVRPNVVVYMHSGNDFSDDLRFSLGIYSEIRNKIPGRSFLRDHSALYAVLSRRALSVLAAMGIWKPGIKFETEGEGGVVSDLADERREGRDLTCKTLAAIDRFVRVRGGRFLVTTNGLYAKNGSIEYSSDGAAVKDCVEAA